MNANLYLLPTTVAVMHIVGMCHGPLIHNSRAHNPHTRSQDTYSYLKRFVSVEYIA